MTDSIFDPTGGNVERSGSTYTTPEADQYSHLPEEFSNPKPVEVTGLVDFVAPPEKPRIEVSSENDGKLLVIRIHGTLHKDDYQHFVPVVETAVQRHGKVRILLQMHNFHGWDAGAFWEDVKFDVKHFNDIERLAIVGERTWEKWMAAFCKPFTTATIRYFPSEQAADARAWVTAELGKQDASEPGVLRVFQSKAEKAAFYNKIAKVYDLLAETSEGPVRQAALDKLAVREGEKILEIGFGTGHCLVAIAKAVGPSGKAFGIDISDQMLRLTSELAQQEQVADRLDLRCGDATQLPFTDGSLDGVFMSFTLELFDTPEIPKVLAECKRVLRPGGRIVVAGMSKEDAHGMVFEMYEWTHRHFPNFVDCRPIFVHRALEAAGFSINDAQKMSMWVPVEVVTGMK